MAESPPFVELARSLVPSITKATSGLAANEPAGVTVARMLAGGRAGDPNSGSVGVW